MSSRVAARYAKSLLDLTSEKGSSDAVYAEMQALKNLIKESSDLADLLRNPIVSTTHKRTVLAKIFSGMSEDTRSFVDLVADRKRESDLVDMAQNYIERYDALKGIGRAEVRSAIPLNNDTMERVKTYLQNVAGAGEIQLENVIDPSVLGGMVVHYEDKLLDMSVATELKEISKQLIYN
ncbi:MAG: F0F1 ATP synthase subunit delta [Flavobacteriales bacterium]|nr:F0F1 ATP synthase subunit delta [Bacteroidota bacterium]MCB9240262.1 F0F1 ATP synthase subunit delta [Flavobacteriales bacterium]